MNAAILPALLTGALHLVVHVVALAGCIILAARTRRPEAVAMTAGSALTTLVGLASTVAMTAMVSHKLPHQGYAAISGFLQIGYLLGGLTFGGGLLTFALRSSSSRP
jgi:hypothetical protein